MVIKVMFTIMDIVDAIDTYLLTKTIYDCTMPSGTMEDTTLAYIFYKCIDVFLKTQCTIYIHNVTTFSCI